MITASDLDGVDPQLALRVLAVGRSIAPCLDTLEDGPGDEDPKPRSTAIAILTATAKDGVALRRPRHIKSERIGPGGAEYWPDVAWFSPEDQSALRALCASAASLPGLPEGSFPKPSRAISRTWPEDC